MAGPLNILIVEDEPLIAMMLEDFIAALEHEVAGTADSVAAALDLVRAGGFDAAILDVNLRGGETCWPIAEALSARGIPFALATGGSDEAIAEPHRRCPVLAKPYSIASVGRAIDSLGLGSPE